MSDRSDIGTDMAEPPRPEPEGDVPWSAAPPAMPAADQRAATVRLLLVVLSAAVVSILAGVGKTVAVVLAIILMIVLHEAGHFVMAKLAGIKVTEFFVGFGTRLWSIRRGETEYGVKFLPLGGYVKIIGMNSLEQVDPADEARTYRQKPYWRRLSVAVAGSVVHFLIALTLLFTVFFVIGDRGLYTAPPGDQARVGAIDGLTSGPSPAQLAGFQLGDRIVAADGHSFKTVDDLISYIRSKPEQTLDVEVIRHGQLIHLHPTTVDLAKVEPAGSAGAGAPAATKPTGFIGFVVSSPPVHFGFVQSISKAGGAFVDLTARTFDALGSLFSAHGISSYGNMLVNKQAANAPNALRFESPVGIVRIAHQATDAGIESVLSILILINIFVGIFNMVPLLPLDGGHVAVATYEAIRSRKGRPYHADAAKLLPLTYATFAVIVFIGVSALFLDLRDVLSMVKF